MRPKKSDSERAFAASKAKNFSDQCARPAGGGECSGMSESEVAYTHDGAPVDMAYEAQYGSLDFGPVRYDENGDCHG